MLKAFNQALNRHFPLVSLVALLVISLPLATGLLKQNQTISSKAQQSSFIVDAEALCERGYPKNLLSWQKQAGATVYRIDRSDGNFFYSTAVNYPDYRVVGNITYTYTVTGMDGSYKPVSDKSKEVTVGTKDCVSQPQTNTAAKKATPTPIPASGSAGFNPEISPTQAFNQVPPQQVSFFNTEEAPQKPGFLEQVLSQDNLPILVTLIVIVLVALGIGFKFVTRKKYQNVDWDWVKSPQ